MSHAKVTVRKIRDEVRLLWSYMCRRLCNPRRFLGTYPTQADNALRRSSARYLPSNADDAKSSTAHVGVLL